MPSKHDLVEQQKQYYRERAPEYDDWWNRRGRYDLGEEHRNAWDHDKDQLRGHVHRLPPAGSILELAGGTGTWTEVLVERTDDLTVVDSSPETLAINRQKCGSAVSYVCADIFDLDLGRAFDLVFFSFWLTHVPDTRFEAFWRVVERHLTEAGRVFFIDSAHPLSDRTDAAADDHVNIVSPHTSTNDLDAGRATRTLADGRSFEIVKRFWHPDDLKLRLRELGWAAEVRTTKEFFLFGTAERA